MSMLASFEAPSVREAFEADSSLDRFGQNALSIFVLTLYLRLEDQDEFASDAITEGPDDKKLDICHLDEENGRLILVQSYFSKTWGRKSAPSGKAGDLITAIGWLLSASEDLIPAHLQTKASEVRRALATGTISRIEILYIHNCGESVNAQSELQTAADTARDIARGIQGDHGNEVTISFREMGINAIKDLYQSRDSEILVDEWIDLPIGEFIEEKGDEWRAIIATIPTEWIRQLYQHHSDRLFSANYRDYLGYTRREGNINYQISATAQAEPTNFWVFNNGITGLTYELDLDETPRIRGISIINGAQTTGALSEPSVHSEPMASVVFRIVECQSPELVDKIIRYNNTQNEIKPADRRSNDSTQRRIKTDFGHFGIEYVHRRSATRTPRNAITAAAIAPALCAFHGDPRTSYRNSTQIFDDDQTYQRVFPPSIRVEHIFLVRALSISIDAIKSNLKKRVSEQQATKLELSQYEVLKYSASKHFLFFIIGAMAEEILNRRVSDAYEWKCISDLISPDNVSLSKAWIVTVQALLPHIATIVSRRGEDAFYDVPRSYDNSVEVAEELKALISSLESTLGSQFDELRQRSVL